MVPEAAPVGEGECCPPLLNCCNMCPEWYATVDWLFMDRTRGAADRPLLVDFNTGAPLLTTDDLDFDWTSGARFTVGKRLCSGRAIEFGYFGWFDGEAGAAFENTDPDVIATFPGDLGPGSNVFFDVDRVRVDYDSRLNSFEVNLPCCCCCCFEDPCTCSVRCRSVEWFTGFRYIRLDENLTIAGERDEEGGTEDAVYSVETDNNLYGVQLGGRLRRCTGRWSWEGTGKAGVYGNDAQQRQEFIDFPGVALRSYRGEDDGSVAFVGELNLTAIYHLTNVWGIRTGYNLMWIEGVALAPDQLDFTFTESSGRDLIHDGGFLLHGVSFGLEGRW